MLMGLNYRTVLSHFCHATDTQRWCQLSYSIEKIKSMTKMGLKSTPSLAVKRCYHLQIGIHNYSLDYIEQFMLLKTYIYVFDL